MSKTFTTVLLVILTALVVGGAVYWLKPSTEVNVSITIEQMRKIARLATTEWTMSAFVDQTMTSKTMWSAIGVGDRKVTDFVIAKCKGKVSGSVDMEKAQINAQETSEGRRVAIHFPRGSILVSDPAINTDDPKSFETISCREKLKMEQTFFHSATGEQRNALQREAIKQIKRAAIDAGIVDKTIENAHTVLGEFVGSLGYKATITFDKNAYDPKGAEALAALPAKGE